MKDSKMTPQHKRMAMGLPVNGMSAAKAKKEPMKKPEKK